MSGIAFNDATAIVGIGQTEFAKNLQPTELELACVAVKQALDDAGIKPEEVDALGCYTMEDTPEFELARNLGLGDIHFFSRVNFGGGAAPGAIGQVALAVASGIANVGVVWRSRKRSDPRKRVWAKSQAVIDDHWKWSRPWGLLRPVDEVALTTRRYMHNFGMKRDTLALVATTLRAYANNNPKAAMYQRTMSTEDYLQARMVADPLCLFDNCLETDGAVAVVITRADRAKDCLQKPAYIHSFSQGLAKQHQLMSDYHQDDPLQSSSWVTARNLWANSELSTDDIDVAQFYDAFSPLIPFSLEAYGFCEQGGAADFIAEKGIGFNGALPVNTAGGSLSEAYIHGMNLVTEGVRQVRGSAVNQVQGAKACLVTSCDSTPNGALILRSER